jgi:hypothetical protein
MNPIKARSEEAMRAKLRGGAGKHQDRRLKRQRTRSAQKRAAIREA